MEFPESEKIIDITTAAQFMMALSENSNVYYWGKNQVPYIYVLYRIIIIKLFHLRL